MKKVVFLAPTPPPASGIASWMVRILNCGLGENWTPVVVDEKVIGKRGVFQNSRRNLREEFTRTLSIWKGLNKELKSQDAKVVQSCIPPSTFAMIREYGCLLITHAHHKKFIIHYRSTLPNYVTPGINEFVFKLLSKKSDMVFVLNGPSEDMIKKVVGEKYRLIPNFIENKLIVSSREINKNLQTALYVGGVTEDKGCKLIIESAKQFPQITFRLVGAISEEISKIEIPKNVVLVGEKSKSEVIEEMKNADVFLFLSKFRGEGFSNSLVEAMAAGLPCIVTDWAANADMVIDTKGGYVIKTDDADNLKKSLGLIADASKRKEMSDFNIKRATECYSQDVVIKQYTDVYEKMINI